jgi:hypothetical protein
VQRFGTLALLTLLVVEPVAAQTATPEPRVRGCFSHTDTFCAKRCGDEASCFKECKTQCIEPGDGDSIRLQPKKQG